LCPQNQILRSTERMRRYLLSRRIISCTPEKKHLHCIFHGGNSILVAICSMPEHVFLTFQYVPCLVTLCAGRSAPGGDHDRGGSHPHAGPTRPSVKDRPSCVTGGCSLCRCLLPELLACLYGFATPPSWRRSQARPGPNH